MARQNQGSGGSVSAAVRSCGTGQLLSGRLSGSQHLARNEPQAPQSSYPAEASGSSGGSSINGSVIYGGSQQTASVGKASGGQREREHLLWATRASCGLGLSFGGGVGTAVQGDVRVKATTSRLMQARRQVRQASSTKGVQGQHQTRESSNRSAARQLRAAPAQNRQTSCSVSRNAPLRGVTTCVNPWSKVAGPSVVIPTRWPSTSRHQGAEGHDAGTAAYRPPRQPAPVLRLPQRLTATAALAGSRSHAAGGPDAVSRNSAAGNVLGGRVGASSAQ